MVLGLSVKMLDRVVCFSLQRRLTKTLAAEQTLLAGWDKTDGEKGVGGGMASMEDEQDMDGEK